MEESTSDTQRLKLYPSILLATSVGSYRPARRRIRAYSDRICRKVTFHFERLFYSPINKSTFSITDGSPVLNNVAHVTLADIEAENGVVHVITHILIPSSLASVVG